MIEIDLKAEQPIEKLQEIRAFARDFFLCGGSLTLPEWLDMHESVRGAFKMAKDDVTLDRLKTLNYLLRTGG